MSQRYQRTRAMTKTSILPFPKSGSIVLWLVSPTILLPVFSLTKFLSTNETFYKKVNSMNVIKIMLVKRSKRYERKHFQRLWGRIHLLENVFFIFVYSNPVRQIIRTGKVFCFWKYTYSFLFSISFFLIIVFNQSL